MNIRLSSVGVALLLLAGCDSEEDDCFIGETLIATPTGLRAIRELAPGDAVLSFDAELGTHVTRNVKQVMRKQVTTVCRLELSLGGVQGVTPTHPFFDVTRKSYVPLRDLKPDAELRVRMNDGQLATATIDKLTIQEGAKPTFEVFNLEVEGPEHNYFADGVLVHNKSPGQPSCPEGKSYSGEQQECQCDDGLVPADDGSDTCIEDDNSGGQGGAGGGGAGGGGAGGGGAGGGGAGGGGQGGIGGGGAGGGA